MKLQTQSIMGELDRLSVPFKDRPVLVSLALAKIVAYRLPIPAEAAGNGYRFFVENHKEEMENLLAEVNEQLVIDIDAVTDLTQRLWTLRYRIVHEANNQATRDFMDAMVRVGGREIPASVSEMLIRNDDKGALETVRGILEDALSKDN